MNKKNHKLLFYVLGIAILAGAAFLATKEFVPEKTLVEVEVSTNK